MSSALSGTSRIALFALASSLLACDGPTATATAPVSQVSVLASKAGQAGLGSTINKDLAALRQATASFHRFDAASKAGWSTQITGCMTDPNFGGMGYHYGNVDLIDGSVSVDKPELLLYEPEKNGNLRLVAAEYIIPYAFHSRDADPPVLFGQPFKQVDAFQLWGLHAWAWETNPSGIVADGNPRVTCAHAADAMVMSH
jgi:hypothetical protein